jgi:hypothetical protein
MSPGFDVAWFQRRLVSLSREPEQWAEPETQLHALRQHPAAMKPETTPDSVA